LRSARWAGTLAAKISAVNETTPTHKLRARKSGPPLNVEGESLWLSMVPTAVFCVGITFAPRYAR
jgi:hypothetical protein